MKKLLLLIVAAVFLHPQVASSVTRGSTLGSISTNVRIELTDPAGSVYQEDEAIQLSISTDAEAYVVVFNIDTDGFVHILYPADSRSFRKMKSGRRFAVPERSDEMFLIAGSTGLEMVFALAVKDKDDIDELEVSFLINNANLPAESKYRVEGDPFLAANDIVSRLVRGIEGKEGVSLAYTYFYINEPVDFPRYLCADCYDSGADPYADGMPTYEPTVAFDSAEGLTYPLVQGFDRFAPAAQRSQPGVTYDGGAVTETHVYVHHTAPRWHYYYPSAWYWWDYWYWRPYCYTYYPYFPHSGFYYSVSWNWGYHHGGYYGHRGNYYNSGGYVYTDARGSFRPGTRYKGSGGVALYNDMNFKTRETQVARRDGFRSKTAGTTNSRKVALRPSGNKRVAGASGGPIAQLRPEGSRGKGIVGGPIVQQGPNTRGTAYRGKTTRTVKPLSRSTRSDSKYRSSVQNRSNLTKGVRGNSKYRSSTKSTATTRGNSSAWKSRSKTSRPSYKSPSRSSSGSKSRTSYRAPSRSSQPSGKSSGRSGGSRSSSRGGKKK